MAAGGQGWDAYLADLLAAVLVCGGIGWLIDRWLGTAPWGMIVGVMLGHACGIYMLWLRSAQADKPEPSRGDDA